MEWLTSWTAWHWLILGLVLLIAEIMMPGVFLLWWGLAAIVISGVSLALPSIPISIILTCYALLAIALSLVWWYYQHNKDKADQHHTSLNQRDHAMIGTRGVVQEINQNNIGRGYFGDTTWRVKGNYLRVGDIVEVISVDGITLLVQKVENNVDKQGEIR